MTKEEAKQILERIMNNNFYGGEVQTACKMGIEALSQPSLPSNLDEAAEEIASDIVPTPDIGWDECFEKIKDGIKAGAEWMAEQGETFNGYISVKGKRSLIAIEGKSDIYKFGDEVVVQIRKK